VSTDPEPEPKRLPLTVVGRVDRACDAFEVAWRAGGRPRLEEFLDEMPELGRMALLRELIAAEVELRRASGERPTPEEYAPRFPGEETLINDVFSGTTSAGGAADVTLTLAPPGAPGSDVGGSRGPDDRAVAGVRYRILRSHARGGLGEVFLALDSELHREVALKQILDDRADDPASRARFLLEAEVTGRLEHPGVVPVYSLGHDDRGRPYYAMRLVRGDSLKEAILAYHRVGRGAAREPGGGPVEFRKLLGRFIGVCHAVAYAHSRGVLHRDLKPANILLGPYGETLVVDWGLAKPVGRDDPGPAVKEAPLRPLSGSGTCETEAGAVVGTPSYMSPEQARGDLRAVGPLSDVYSLGATLYCLLTGDPPFEGGPVEVLGRVQRGDFQAPRQVNPAVPPALEAVCLKAMALKPDGRYASAEALAEDVEHWLADEPVDARPEPWPARLARWARRHKPAVAAVAVLLAAAAVANAVHGILIGREQRETERQRVLAEQRATLLERELYVSRLNLAYRECQANNIVLAERLLDECPPTRRGWEWDYTRRLCHLESMTLRPGPDASDAHSRSSSLSTLAVSPDGARIAATDGSSTVVLWDAATGRPLPGLRGDGPMFCIAFSPDGTLAAVGGFREVTLWEVGPWKRVGTFQGLNDMVTGVAFSPDGTRLAACTTTRIEARHLPETKLWDVASGREVATYDGEDRWGTQSLAFSPDGSRVAVVLSWRRAVVLLDAATARAVGTLTGGSGLGLVAATFSPDGRQIAATCFDGTVLLFDTAAGSVIRIFRGHTRTATGIAFGPDGRRLASAGADGTVRLWETETGREIASFRGHDGPAGDLRFFADGTRLASTGVDGTVKVWDVAAAGDVMTLGGNRGWAFLTAFAPDGRLVTGGFSVVTVRDPATGHTAREVSMPGGGVRGLALSPDGRRVAVAREFSPEFELWDLADGRHLATFRIPEGRVHGLAFAPNGKRIASAGDDGSVRIWDASTGQEVRTLPGHEGGAYAVAYRPDGRRLASIGWDRAIRLWDPESGAAVLVMQGAGKPKSPNFGGAVAFSPDGRRLAVAGAKGRVVVRDAETGAEVLTPPGANSEVNAVAFDPAGRRLASAHDDGTLKLWDAATGDEVFTLRGHTAGVLGVAFSRDGLRIASASKDMTVKVWDAGPPSPEAIRLRREALLADDRREEARRRNDASWAVVAAQGRPTEAYVRALLDAEVAVRLAPDDGMILNTLGVARYRAGKFAEALDTLSRSNELNAAGGAESMPADLAFLAMAHHRLGQSTEARAMLEKLRVAMKQVKWKDDPESRGFFREAEALIAPALTLPVDPFAP
jgi:eukaryotic-like serine/threonine-protein kinase